jgi:EAL domain-containing protein (putative c-di-GMP-specific phosphodiesterase class I)
LAESLSPLRTRTGRIIVPSVGDITTDPDDAAIASTIIAMAHPLGLNVVAGGMETAQQYEYLHPRGCDEILAFWFSHPLEPEARPGVPDSPQTRPLAAQHRLMR